LVAVVTVVQEQQVLLVRAAGKEEQLEVIIF
jgi:hypothetical protein